MHCGRVWVDEYLVKWVGYGLFEATWEPSAHLANAPLPWPIFWSLGEGHVWGHVSLEGGVMLGFDVWFCLFVAVYSTITVVHVYVYALYVLCAYCTYLPCVWGKYTKGDRTIDRVRVNGF